MAFLSFANSQSPAVHVVSDKMVGHSIASTETLSLAIMCQNSLSTLTAIYDTDAVVLDAAVSHVTRLSQCVHWRQWRLCHLPTVGQF